MEKTLLGVFFLFETNFFLRLYKKASFCMDSHTYFHLTTNVHDSRTSNRMLIYKARERRFHGTLPYPDVYYMSLEEEILIAKEVFSSSKELDFEVFALNLCRDHMHLLVFCKEDEVSKIMHRIKGRTARACNAHRAAKGINPLDATRGKYEPRTLKDKSIPFWTQKYHCKVIRNSDQLLNTINYIHNNRKKHGLPINFALQNLIDKTINCFSECDCIPGRFHCSLAVNNQNNGRNKYSKSVRSL